MDSPVFGSVSFLVLLLGGLPSGTSRFASSIVSFPSGGVVLSPFFDGLTVGEPNGTLGLLSIVS
ncbi:hypothetical protein NLX71_12685 [Paenibacillus sp. MZ04-78.2]|uniref:hypothetical protein n=1 Tax=Paenibacillus sp. MZ04-78.2 TaxID=2962034 RepID=UPI0020B88C45|nr:hypothetical protein [Paenibacillus sp. MZ04-78.2]MCP3774159.1 hypothetical protein [Paenibacillus sp. MZ04-78.2]